jgi:hypothetical protein
VAIKKVMELTAKGSLWQIFERDICHVAVSLVLALWINLQLPYLYFPISLQNVGFSNMYHHPFMLFQGLP